MANLISNANAKISGTGGNAFGTCETATGAFNFPASGLPSTAQGTGITTTKKYTPTFSTTNGNVCDAILVYVFFPVGTSTGTATFFLNNGTSDVGSVTVNAADFPLAASGTTGGSFTLLKLASPVTLDGTANWKVGFIGSANQGTLVNATVTTNDVYKALRLTTTATPASGDHVFIVGELTGAGTNNPRTVTMDYTSNTIAPGQTEIGWLGTLAYGTTSSTNYYLRLTGFCYVWNGGTLTIGTSGSPMPSSSTGVLEFNCGSNVQYGLEAQALSTVNTYGAGKFLMTHLNGDVAAGATSLTTADDTSATWAVGDTIVIAPTGQTFSQVDAVAISTISGTALTCPALAFDHSGTIYTGSGSTTFDTRAEVINLTRNVKIRGISASLQSYVNIASSAAVNFQNSECYWLGSATASKRGIDVGTTTGSATFNGCSIHDFVVASSVGLFMSVSNYNNITISNNVSYNCFTNHISFGNSSSLTNWSINNCVGIYSPTGGSAIFLFNSVFGTISNLTTAGSVNNGVNISGGATAATPTISGLMAHSCNGYGINLANVVAATFNNITAWRNINSGGVILGNCLDSTFNTVQTFGNTAGVFLNSSVGNCTFTGVTADAKAFTADTFIEAQSVSLGGGGQGSGFNVAFASSDLGQTFPHARLTNSSRWSGTVVFDSCNIADISLMGSQNIMGLTSRVGLQKLNNVAGNHSSYYKYGSISLDTTLYYSASPSQRITPNGGSGNILQSAPFSCGVASGNNVAPMIYVRCSATGAGDSTSYNGVAPTLYVVQNIPAGISSDTLLATVPSSYLPGGANQGQWYALTGSTANVTDDAVLSFYVACDGSTGWINIDTASVS